MTVLILVIPKKGLISIYKVRSEGNVTIFLKTEFNVYFQPPFLGKRIPCNSRSLPFLARGGVTSVSSRCWDGKELAQVWSSGCHQSIPASSEIQYNLGSVPMQVPLLRTPQAHSLSATSMVYLRTGGHGNPERLTRTSDSSSCQAVTPVWRSYHLSRAGPRKSKTQDPSADSPKHFVAFPYSLAQRGQCT